MALTIDLSGRKALVSGVSSGIGFSIARLLARAGCDVAGCGLEDSESLSANRFIETINQEGRKGYYFSRNLSFAADCEAWVDEGVKTLGGCDILISNAGKNIFREIGKCDEESWREGIDLNLASHWRVCKKVAPFLKNSNAGVIVIMGSNHANAAMKGCFPYNIAKAGLKAMVQSMAIEWGPSIRALGIEPGFIDTPGNQQWFDSFPDPRQKRVDVERSHPVGRIGSPEEIAALCAFVSSSWGRFISGNMLLMDGGMSAHLE